MEQRYIAAIDLGSSKIALSIAKVSGENVEVLYYSVTPSDGIRYSTVFNPGSREPAQDPNPPGRDRPAPLQRHPGDCRRNA